MPNPFSKGWKYLTSSLDHAIDENADPQIQLQQAADEAMRQHKSIVDHAAVLLGDRRQWEMKLHRLQEQQQKLENQARTALNAGDSQVAEIYATQLVTVEQQLDDAKTMHAQAEEAANQAQRMVKESELRLQDQMSQLNELRAQSAQAAMQQTVSRTINSMENTGLRDPDANTPTLDAVREKIERRYATALGAQELAETSAASRMEEIVSSQSDFKASARLDEIRAQLAAENQQQLTPGTNEQTAENAQPVADDAQSVVDVDEHAENVDAEQTAVEQTAVEQTAVEQTAVEQTAVEQTAESTSVPSEEVTVEPSEETEGRHRAAGATHDDSVDSVDAEEADADDSENAHNQKTPPTASDEPRNPLF